MSYCEQMFLPMFYLKYFQKKPKTEVSVAHRNGSAKPKPSVAKSQQPKSEAAKARDEARKKMLEAKKRQMKQKQQNDNNEMFVQIC